MWFFVVNTIHHIACSILVTTNHCEKCNHYCHNNSTCGCYEDYTLSSNGYTCIECAKLNVNSERNQLKPTWHVTLCSKNNKSIALLCGGSLLNDQWIVTSAQCVCGIASDKSSLSVRLKKQHTCVVEENGELELSVSKIHCHPNYNNSYTDLVDVALIKTQFPVPSEEVKNTMPLCLPINNAIELYNYGSSGNLNTYGLGNPKQVVDARAKLTVATMSLAPQHSCYRQFRRDGIDYKQNENFFCTNVDSPTTCVGNPGSGIFSIDLNGKINFAGVISKFTKVCGEFKSYSANTKVQYPQILDWINEIIAKED